MEVNAIFEEMVSIRRDLHQHPEIEFDLQRTVGVVTKELRASGLTVKEKVKKSGVVADLRVPGATITLAFRADMDALPMQEEGNLPYKSQTPGRAHMCGHDCHTAMLLGAAKLLANRREELKKNIRFIFQPSEEKYPGGARLMIEDGALDGVQEIYALHVWPWLPVGAIGISRGPAMAQADLFKIKIKGLGGHAAAPHATVDPILIAAHLVTMLQSIVSRNVSPLQTAVVSVTQFHAGSTHNVIPSSASIVGTVRSYCTEVQKKVKARIKSLAKNITEAMGGSYEIEYSEGYPPVMNEIGCEKKTQAAARKFLKEKDVNYPVQGEMFGEDFSYYTQKIPGCFIQLGCRNEKTGIVHPLHHPCFNVDENCMKVGVELFIQLAVLG